MSVCAKFQLAGLEVAEKFVGGGMVGCQVIIMPKSNASCFNVALS